MIRRWLNEYGATVALFGGLAGLVVYLGAGRVAGWTLAYPLGLVIVPLFALPALAVAWMYLQAGPYHGYEDGTTSGIRRGEGDEA
ncbi:hypothetical protein [Maricaulis sp. CAU 1757]